MLHAALLLLASAAVLLLLAGAALLLLLLGLATVDPTGVLAPQRLFTWTAQAAIPAAGGQ